jgi:hypothetical protein
MAAGARIPAQRVPGSNPGVGSNMTILGHNSLAMIPRQPLRSAMSTLAHICLRQTHALGTYTDWRRFAIADELTEEDFATEKAKLLCG